MKKCGFVIRVSTDKQAANEEGSLKNQLQRLLAHIEYKNGACGEDWVETGLLILALRVLSKNLSTLDPKAVDESRDTLARAIAVVGRRTREGVV